MTILVTGGAGFIGSNFLHQAVNCFSEKIICVDNLSYASDYEQIKDLPIEFCNANIIDCLLYTSPSPRDRTRSRMPSSA